MHCEILLGESDEERALLIASGTSPEVHAGAVHRVVHGQFGNEDVEHVDLVERAVVVVQEGPDRPVQVGHSVQLDSGSCRAQARPRNQEEGRGDRAGFLGVNAIGHAHVELRASRFTIGPDANEKPARTRGPSNAFESDEGPAERLDEVDTADGLASQSVVIGNEQVHPGRSRAGKLDRVRRPDGSVLPDLGIVRCRVDVERQHGRTAADRLLVAQPKSVIIAFGRLDQNLPEGEGRGEQQVTPFRHPPVQLQDLARSIAGILDQVDEQVRIPEHPAHYHRSLSRLT